MVDVNFPRKKRIVVILNFNDYKPYTELLNHIVFKVIYSFILPKPRFFSTLDESHAITMHNSLRKRMVDVNAPKKEKSL